MQLRTLVVSLLLIMFAGCVSLPAQQMSDARQALQAAKAAGAEDPMIEEFKEASILLNDANRFLEERRYELAGKVAQRAKSQALAARRKAVEMKSMQP
ncbi:MAG: hypothetical protein DSZ28_08160 [Thiothrix sp.]|nr:MAG: hypothetical protein DSZ28_08160 [Thiothrix sp.]